MAHVTNFLGLLEKLQSADITVHQNRCAVVRNRNATCMKCAEVCTSGCISYNDNELIISPEKCIGCGTCAIVCPYNAPKVDEEKKKAVRCNGCAERVAAGEKPVCVEACPARALDFGDADEMAKMGERGNIAPLPDPSETTPNIFIKASADAQPVGAAEIANPLEVA